MRAVLQHLTDNDEIGVVGFGQSNRRPWGHRDREGYVAAPHLKLRAPGMDLTILSILGITSAAHGAATHRSIVNVAEALATNDWINGELRLVQHEHGDTVTSTLRRGHAKVLSNAGVASSTVTFDVTADTVYWPSHGRKDGSQVQFTTTSAVTFVDATNLVQWTGHGLSNGRIVLLSGTLPSPLAANTPYFIVGAGANDFQVSLTSGGAAVDFAGGTGTATVVGLTGSSVYFIRDATDHTFKVSADPYGTAVNIAAASGTHTATARSFLVVQWVSEFQAAATVSFGDAGGILQVSWTAHNIPHGSTVSFTSTGTLPTGVPSGQLLYVVLPGANSAWLSLTYGGTPILFVDAGTATITGTPGMLANVSGYVHLHDKFNSYDNVQMVTPYQPIEPGDYPAGVPVVPGFSLAADVALYRDAGLVLPFAWNEGIEGHGTAGTAMVSGLVVTLTTGGPVTDKLFADGFIRCGPSKGKVASNTTTTVTVASWTPSTPGTGTHSFEIHLPHWRNNPAHYTAGEGFLYPNGDMLPGGGSSASLGYTYSRPRARFIGSYVSRQLANAPASTAINASGVARCTTVTVADLVISIASGKLRIQRGSDTINPANGLIQFETFLRVGYIVALAGMGQTPSINGNWRVSAMGHTYGAAGSFIDLDQLSATDPAVPASVTPGTAPVGATITRLFWEPQHRFGSWPETLWRMAVVTGRRIIGTVLGVNSSGQLAAITNNAFAFQGRIGWFDDDDALDWTPSNPDGNAARLKRLIEFIAPRAVTASLGSAKLLKQLAIDAYQLEADSLSVIGRELAPRTIPTFATWLRTLIEKAGQSPYPVGAKIPFHWAQLSHTPWELAGSFYGVTLAGDTEGIINAALDAWAATDGFAASFNTDDSLTLDGTTLFGLDPLHYNGYGAVRNGKGAADLLLPLIDFAFSFALGPNAIAMANQALSLLSHVPNIVSLEPPDDTEQARLCARHFAEARDAVLQRHPWSFATRRAALVAVTNTASTSLYSYAVPADLLNVTGIFDPEASSDVQTTDLQPASEQFRIETDAQGNRVLRTDLEGSIVRYTAKTVDMGLWDPLARAAFAARLAGLMAGPALQGRKGTLVGQSFIELSEALINQAAAFNANYQADVRPKVTADWLPPQ